jgi:dTDP-4-amino-4,6-dideoxygalactose transaminase
MIPFVDLNRQYLSIKNEMDIAIQNVINETAFIGGYRISNFEKSFADWLGVKHCIGCANGTDSIEILLKSIGIGSGDEVIVPAISWISTSEAVSAVGANPVFVDIDAETYTIDVTKIQAVINKKTKAIIPVHLYGQPADMLGIMNIAEKYNLKVLEDCAQAHGAKINGQRVGTFGDAASFSFYPGKNLGAYGDAGGMVTNNDEIARIARRIANHGQEGKHNHISEGRNSRLDGIQAAVLSVKLPYLNKWVDARNDLALIYLDSINNTNFGLPKLKIGQDHAWHLFVIRTNKRDELKNYLKENGVETAIHYPTALPFLACYSDRGYKKFDFPIAFEYQQSILSIPMFPELEMDEIKKVISLLNEFVA